MPMEACGLPMGPPTGRRPSTSKWRDGGCLHHSLPRARATAPRHRRLRWPPTCVPSYLRSPVGRWRRGWLTRSSLRPGTDCSRITETRRASLRPRRRARRSAEPMRMVRASRRASFRAKGGSECAACYASTLHVGCAPRTSLAPWMINSPCIDAPVTRLRVASAFVDCAMACNVAWR